MTPKFEDLMSAEPDSTEKEAFQRLADVAMSSTVIIRMLAEFELETGNRFGACMLERFAERFARHEAHVPRK